MNFSAGLNVGAMFCFRSPFCFCYSLYEVYYSLGGLIFTGLWHLGGEVGVE